MTKPPLTTVLPALLPLTLLMACGQQNASTAVPAAQAVHYDYVATVPLQTNDTQASLASALGGTVLSWPSGCATDCTALMGFKSSGGLSAQSLGLKAQGLRIGTVLEANTASFHNAGTMVVGGSMGAWASGSMGAWASGSMGAWASGTYIPLPQNSSVWNQINLQQAQTLAPNLGSGVVVAVIDTGMDLNDTAFQGTLTDSSTWQDFYAGGTTPQDQGQLGVGAYGHGTNVAGIVLQIAPKAKIMPLRVLGPDGSGDVAAVAQAITWAVQHGANIINLSMGSTTYSSAVQNAIVSAAKNNVMVVASAGNTNSNTITYPAASFTGSNGNYMLSVGSVDGKDQKSSFGNYNSVLELSAPGENVYGPAPLNYLAAWSGTSQAAPMATGGLALALGELMANNIGASYSGNWSLYSSVAGMQASMMSKSASIYSSSLNSSYKNLLGKGRLDLAAFLKDALGE